MEDAKNNNPLPDRYTDEIDLIDLWFVLVRRRWIIALVFLAGVLGAAAAIAFTPAQYQTSTVIEVGEIYGANNARTYLEDPQSLIARLDAAVPASTSASIKEVNLYGGKKSAVKNIINIVTTGSNATAMRDYLASLATQIVADHAARYAAWLERQQALIAQSRDELSRIEQDLLGFGELTDSLRNAEPAQAAVVEIEKSRLRERLTELRDKLAEREFFVANSSETRILKDAMLPARPEKPRPALYLALGGFLGLFFGMFAAFVAEFIAKARLRLKDAAAA